MGQKKKEGPSIGLLALAEKEDTKSKKAAEAPKAAEKPKEAPKVDAPKADAPKADAPKAPVVAVAMGDLKNTPVPNGPHTKTTVINGNTTTDAMIT